MNIIEPVDGRYFLGVWFVGDGSTKDWLCCVFKDPGDDFWQLRYRFKYYNSPDPFDEDDRRSSYSGTLHATEQDVEGKIQFLATEIISAEFGELSEVTYVPLHTNEARQVMRVLQKQPWAHAKTISRAEAKQRGLV